MGTWIQDYIKTYDDTAFIYYMCRRLGEINCANGGSGGGISGYSGFSGTGISGYSGYSGQDGTAGGGGIVDSMLLMGG